MARKNLLKGLMEEAAKGPSEDKPRAEPRYTKGAIGAVSQQIAELKARSVVELDPAAIKAGGLFDRLEQDAEAHRVLMESLRTYGQQVPVLVRPDPDEDGAYQIVYGRRRVAALRDLGQPVKALIRNLDDAEAIMAQGQENSARRDLSFIERVNFARQMAEAGYDRKVIGDALSTDKTLISRMLAVAEIVPVEVIEGIGAAPGIGRDRWLAFAKLWQATGWDVLTGVRMVESMAGPGSDERFDGLMAWMEKHHTPQVIAAPKATKPLQKFYEAAPGKLLGKLTRGKDTVKIEVQVKNAEGFDVWLEENLDEIFRDWKAGRAAEGREE
ncbi:plasmid partitioning protein RepB [Sagittula sp. S175]|uniref:plasmid partitioning protein RepB n=1 Tax=Sagittula sp. S175 TaxID=3415129 RepID=UPI003C7DA295